MNPSNTLAHFALIVVALVVVSYLWKTGLGSALLAFPFGIRPMFPFGAKVETIYGMNPETCQVKAFQEKHHALLQQAKASRLRYYNTYTLQKNFVRAMREILPRMATFSPESRVAALELLLEGLKRKEPQALFVAANRHWRLILSVRSEHPSEEELVKAYKKASKMVQSSHEAGEVIIDAMARACTELGYEYRFH